MYLYGNWSVARKVSDIFIFELAHKYSPHENVLSEPLTELPSPSPFDVFAGRKEGRKEGGGGGKEGRKEERKKRKKEGRMGNIRFCAILTLYTTTSVHVFTILFSLHFLRY